MKTIIILLMFLVGCTYTNDEWVEKPKKGVLPTHGWTRYEGKIVEAHNAVYYKIVNLEHRIQILERGRRVE